MQRFVKLEVSVGHRDGFRGIWGGGQFWPEGWTQGVLKDDADAPPPGLKGQDGRPTWSAIDANGMIKLFPGRTIEQKLAEMKHLCGGQTVLDREAAVGQPLIAHPLLNFRILEDGRQTKAVK
jgi:hypothetical protein